VCLCASWTRSLAAAVAAQLLGRRAEEAQVPVPVVTRPDVLLVGEIKVIKQRPPDYFFLIQFVGMTIPIFSIYIFYTFEAFLRGAPDPKKSHPSSMDIKKNPRRKPENLKSN
jgi:hypothetical protein